MTIRRIIYHLQFVSLIIEKLEKGVMIYYFKKHMEGSALTNIMQYAPTPTIITKFILEDIYFTPSFAKEVMTYLLGTIRP